MIRTKIQKKTSIHDLYKVKKIKLIPANPNKKIESEYVYPFYKIDKNKINRIKIYSIILNPNTKINDEINKAYKIKSDIIILSFNKKPHLPIYEIPKFPIYYDGNIYITPILIEQINGFTNKTNQKEFVFIDFIGRIYKEIGVILSTSNFIYINQHPDDTGIKDNRNGILKYSNVSKIEKWISNYIPKHEFGWMAPINKCVINYIFDNYDIQNVAELGIYLGYSTEYINSKNRNMKHYCFDRYDNLFHTNYVVEKVSPLDTYFFFKYLRYETFYSNLSEAKDLYSIKIDNYQSIDFLYQNKIAIDLIYIDFIKQNKKLIEFIDKIFRYYPDVIIIGDDGVYLQEGIHILENKYNCINFHHCYLCKKNKSDWRNIETLLNQYNEMNNYNNIKSIQDIIKIENIEMMYKINFIINEIKKNTKINKIIKYIEILNIDCNQTNNLSDIQNGGNLYHFIANYRFINDKYSKKLYYLLTKKQKDINKKNMLNLIPSDYFHYFISFR
jgi:hypothetical protein